MTYEHAIDVLRDGEWQMFLDMPGDSPTAKEFYEALELAVSSLRRREADEQKKPAMCKWVG